MNPLIITGFGTNITVNRRRLVINNKLKKEHLEFQPHQIEHDSLIIDGYTGNISFEAIRWLSKHDIPLTILNWDGNLIASVQPQEPKNGRLRVKQYEKYLDKKSRYNIARAMVQEKVKKTQDLLVALSDYYEEVDSNETIKVFEFERDSFNKYKSADCDLNKLMLYESRIANRYFSTITKIINKLKPDYNFTGRGTKSYSWNMNASDPVNALLNFGYAIMETEARRAINSAGLDPCVGYLHELAGSKQPLVYDIQELGRWLVDLSIIQLLEDHKLGKSAFVTTEDYHTFS